MRVKNDETRGSPYQCSQGLKAKRAEHQPTANATGNALRNDQVCRRIVTPQGDMGVGSTAGSIVRTLAVILIASLQPVLAATVSSSETIVRQTPTQPMVGQQLFLAAAATTSAATSFTDPFAYCAAVGTIDAPDKRYSGPRVPKAIARGLKKAFAAPATAPLAPFLKNSFWRCMDGKVYACSVGANLPCQEKADTSRTPTSAMAEFCRDNPEADNIPAFVTGRATIYTWRCTTGTPAIVREVTQPDARGFLSTIWYEIPPR